MEKCGFGIGLFAIPFLPQMATHGGKRVGEGGVLFGIPADLTHGQVIGMKHGGHGDDEAEGAEQAWHGAFSSPLRPMALGLEAHVGSQLLEGDLDVIIEALITHYQAEKLKEDEAAPVQS